MASGRVLDFIVFAMILEGAGLVALFRLRGQGVAPGDLLPNLLSGVCLLLSMRLALAGTWWPFISLCLLGALAGHVFDVRRRWKP